MKIERGRVMSMNVVKTLMKGRDVIFYDLIFGLFITLAISKRYQTRM